MDLAQSYNAAREAVSYRAVYGASRAINIKEIAPKESGEPCFTNDMELLNLFKKIRLNSEEEIVEAVDQYIESISFPLKSLQQHHVVIMELVTALFRFSVNNDIAAEGVGGDIGILYGKLLELEPDALRKWLTGYQPLLQRKFGYGKEQINSVLCIKSEGACPQSICRCTVVSGSDL